MLENELLSLILKIVLFPIALISVIFIVVLGIGTLVSIPYFLLFPDHHMHIVDIEGTTHEKKRLKKWRNLYEKLGIMGRFKRAWKVKNRKRAFTKRDLQNKQVHLD